MEESDPAKDEAKQAEEAARRQAEKEAIEKLNIELGVTEVEPDVAVAPVAAAHLLRRWRRLAHLHLLLRLLLILLLRLRLRPRRRLRQRRLNLPQQLLS